MKKLTYLLSALILMAFSGTALAQEAPTTGKSGIGPKLGYYKAPDAEDGTMFIGGQARFRGNSVLGGEFSIEYRGEQTYDFDGSEVNIRQIPVTGSLLLFAPVAPNFQPYGLAGLGAYYTFYDYDDGVFEEADDAEISLGYHLGFGLDLPLNESAAFNIDYRYLFLRGGNEEFDEKEFSGNVISGGITFYF